MSTYDFDNEAPPPAYGESDTKPAQVEVGSSSQVPTAVRTLKAQYASKSGGSLNIYENNESEPIYTAKSHALKILKNSNLEISRAGAEKVGTAKFHFLSTKVDLTVHENAIVMTAFLGSLSSWYSFYSLEFKQKLKWKRAGSALDIVCVDANGTPIARIAWGRGTSKTGYGEIDIYSAEVAKGGRQLDEIIVSGMSWVHMALYMSMAAGGSGSVMAAA